MPQTFAQTDAFSSDSAPLAQGDAGMAELGMAGAEEGTTGVVHEENKGLPQLRFETFPSQIFWLAIVFVALYVVLAKKSLPKIQSVLAAREGKLQDDLGHAAHFQAQATAARETYERTQAEARQHAQTVMHGVQVRMKELSAQSTAEMDAQLQEAAAKADAALAESTARAMQQAETAAHGLAAALIQKITQTSASADELNAALSAAGKPKRAA